MPTPAGWWLLGAAVVTVGLGRLLGSVELYVVAAGAASLVAAAVALTRLVRVRLQVARDVQPLRIHAGEVARVEVRATNAGRTRTPVLRLLDPVTGTPGATLTLASLARGASTRAAYRLPTERRGLLRVGPLSVEVSDPFGLARRTGPAAGAIDVTVFPATDVILPPPQTGGSDPHTGAEHATSLGRSGEDFYALRPYVVGDDLRRVHWPATARHDELMVRQDELPWQGRVTVVLDVNRSAYEPEGFERAVSAAASLVAACATRRDLVRLVTTDGGDSGAGAGHAHVEGIMEHLATVEATRKASLRRTLQHLDGASGGGTLILVLGHAASSDVAALGVVRRRYGSTWVVLFLRSELAEEPLPTSLVGIDVVRVPHGLGLRDAWPVTAVTRSGVA